MTSAFAVLALVAAAALPARAQERDQSVLVLVNGTPVRRADVSERVWRQYADGALNQIVDEILVRQEAARLKFRADVKEGEARLKRIRDQFKDEATFRQRLASSGTSEEALRADISEQVLREALLVKAKELRVTDAELKQAFEANKDKLSTPESVRLRHILVSSEKEANDFLVALRAGADFARLAAQVSLDPASKEKGGDMGLIPRGMLQPELEKLVFELKPGQAAGPVRSQAGFSLFQVAESRAAQSAAFKDVQAALKQALLADKISKAWPGYLAELRAKAKFEPGPQPAR